MSSMRMKTKLSGACFCARSIGAAASVERKVRRESIGEFYDRRSAARGGLISANLGRTPQLPARGVHSAETLDECLDGIDGVFLVWTAPPAAVSSALERILRRRRSSLALS